MCDSGQAAYFFCQFDNSSSLEAYTIIRSLLRQLLEHAKLSVDLESRLEAITRHPALDSVALDSLLQDLFGKQICSFQRTYIVIDALDECEKKHRNIVLKFLRTAISSSQSTLKIFLTSRGGLGDEVRRCCTSVQHLSMGSSEALCNLKVFINRVLRERVANGDLVVGDENLIQEIEDALLTGAQGM